MAAVNEVIASEAIKGVVDFDKAISSADDSLLKFVKDVEMSQTVLKQSKTTTDSINKARKDSKTNIDNLNKSKIESEKINKQLEQTTVKLASVQKGETDELIKAKQSLSEATKERKLAITAQTTEANSIDKLRNRNKQLTSERNKLNLATKEGRKRVNEINKELQKNNDQIKKNVSNLEKQKINIGNYGSAIDRVIPGFSRVQVGVLSWAKGFIS